MNKNQQQELAALISKYSTTDGLNDTAIAPLHYFKMPVPSGRMHVVHDASLCLVVQGEKEVMLEDETYRYAASEFLVVSIDLPVIGQVTVASPEKPYIALQLDIDPRLLSELITETVRAEVHGATTERAVFIGSINDQLTDALLRLARLLDTPRDIRLLAPMVICEIYYRLLNGYYGRRIAQIAIDGTNMQRIARIIRMLKANLSESIRMEELAEMARMSLSSFHFHFKEATTMSPLQYQKRLRLLEARRLLLVEGTDAASAAYRVGYESASQFSREYSRMFGAPPISDVTNLRENQGLIQVGGKHHSR
jgi:AraC-like DNA-binding protein